MGPGEDRREPLLAQLSGRRVGILIASLQAGGAERAAIGLLDGLLARGVDAHLLVLDRNRETVPLADPERRRLLDDRIVHLTAADIGWSTLTKTLLGPWQWLKVQRAIAALRFDVVISVVERANIVNLLRLGGGRRVISVRSYPSELLASKPAFKRWLVVALYRLLLRRADRVVYVSRETAADFERIFPVAKGRGTVIYNACDLEGARSRAREPLPPEWAEVVAQPVVLACGRMSPEKGHASLIRAFAEVARTHRDARLVLVGKGPLMSELVRLRDGLGLTDRVVFPGFQSNPLPWIARARVFVLPSLWEGFPNSLLEALALGVPVISTDCRSGPRELLAPDTDPDVKTTEIDTTEVGFLVPPPHSSSAALAPTREERLLAQAIARALEDDATHARQARAGAAWAEGFAPDRIFPHWLALIEELACGNPRHEVRTAPAAGRR